MSTKKTTDSSEIQQIMEYDKKTGDILSRMRIDTNEMQYAFDLVQTRNSRLYIRRNDDGSYNPLSQENINGMSTYNALRFLYRRGYNLRSERIGYEKKDPRETHPLTLCLMDVNYINDFSISPFFTPHDSCKFVDSMLTVLPKSIWPFSSVKNSKGMIFGEARYYAFIDGEKKKRSRRTCTHDMFSYNIQVNPLLYCYCVTINGVPYYMDSDTFLERGMYEKIANEQFLQSGNQSFSYFWRDITNANFSSESIYDDETDEFIGNRFSFRNKKMLFGDQYTKDLLGVLQNGERYYNFGLAGNSEEEKKEKRGTMFYDILFNAFSFFVRWKLKDTPLFEDAEDFFNNCAKFQETQDVRGFPLDVYASLGSYSILKQKEREFITKLMNGYSQEFKEYYKVNYNLFFGQFFRLLPFLLSPMHEMKLQSPAANILFSAFTIMALKVMKKENNEEYDNIMNSILGVIDNLDDVEYINSSDVGQLFSSFVFSEHDLSKYVRKHLEKILPLLMVNTTATNDCDTENPEDVDRYFSRDFNCYVEKRMDLDADEYLARSAVMLAEFFKKMEKLRFFDAATFAFDYPKSDESRESLKLFSDSLLESCYIHLNTLGSEVFFNGEAPGHSNSLNINPACKFDYYPGVMGMDTTRVAKENCRLFSNMFKDSKCEKENSFHSYMAVINLYTSLAYCARITIDCTGPNMLGRGFYTNAKIERPYSLWAITKKYALHMTFMNHNQFGIWNGGNVSSDDESSQKIKAAHRIKWLTYGLHLRVWFNDNYFYYTNYKYAMQESSGDFDKANENIMRMALDFSGSNLEKMHLFDSYDENLWVCKPAVGLGLAPLAGSHTINSVMYALSIYLGKKADSLPWASALALHGFKDSMVGDSMSSVLGERRDAIFAMFDSKSVSFNNINGAMRRAYNKMGGFSASVYESALAQNLHQMALIISKHFVKNPGDILTINSMCDRSYDISFFNGILNSEWDGIQYYCKNSWCTRILDGVVSGGNKNSFFNLADKILTLFVVANANSRAKLGSDSKAEDLYRKFYGFTSMHSSLVDKYGKGIERVVSDPKNGVFGEAMGGFFYGGTCDIKIANPLENAPMRLGFEDLVSGSTIGGCLLAMSESPYTLLGFNFMKFENSIFNPEKRELYNFGRFSIDMTHSVMKKLIVDLALGGDPIGDMQRDDENALIGKIQEEYFGRSLNMGRIPFAGKEDFSENDAGIWGEVMERGSESDFAAIGGLFLDYDFQASRVRAVLENTYSPDRDGAIEFLRATVDLRKADMMKYNRYCAIEETRGIHINADILNMEESGKCLSLLRKESEERYEREMKKKMIPLSQLRSPWLSQDYGEEDNGKNSSNNESQDREEKSDTDETPEGSNLGEVIESGNLPENRENAESENQDCEEVQVSQSSDIEQNDEKSDTTEDSDTTENMENNRETYAENENNNRNGGDNEMMSAILSILYRIEENTRETRNAVKSMDSRIERLENSIAGMGSSGIKQYLSDSQAECAVQENIGSLVENEPEYGASYPGDDRTDKKIQTQESQENESKLAEENEIQVAPDSTSSMECDEFGAEVSWGEPGAKYEDSPCESADERGNLSYDIHPSETSDQAIYDDNFLEEPDIGDEKPLSVPMRTNTIFFSPEDSECENSEETKDDNTEDTSADDNVSEKDEDTHIIDVRDNPEENTHMWHSMRVLEEIENCPGSVVRIVDPRTLPKSEGSFIKPMVHPDKSVTFFSKTGITVTLDFDDKSCNRPDFASISHKFSYPPSNPSFTMKDVSSPEFMERCELPDGPNANYDEYIYIPRTYMAAVIPEMGEDLGYSISEKYKEETERRGPDYYKGWKFSVKIPSINKMVIKNVPVYPVDFRRLMFPIDSVPIMFNQRIEYIERDMIERVGFANPILVEDFLAKLRKMPGWKTWNQPMSFRNRVVMASNIYKGLFVPSNIRKNEFDPGKIFELAQ